MTLVAPLVRCATARFALRVAARVIPPRSPPALPVSVMGLHFVNPLGLAAGFDRDGSLLTPLALSGFGFIEIGTIRTIARLHRALANVRRHRRHALIGINLASAADGVEPDSVDGSRALMRAAWFAADYLVANLSGPRGAPGSAVSLTSRVATLCAWHAALASEIGSRTPLVVKLALNHAPALDLHGLRASGVDAVIGVSADTDLIARVARALAPLPLISVGGIRGSDDVAARIAAGAALVQVHTAFCRGGPFFPRRLLTELAEGGVARPGVGAGQAPRLRPVRMPSTGG